MHKKLYSFLILFLYILLTLPAMLNHIPWFDEAHAWILAKETDFSDLFSVTRIEGHPVLWFLLIMPFAKLSIAYPYSILMLNYIFCIIALYIMWKHSPFNIFIKLSITFSSMFLNYFPIISRGYSLGLIFLFYLAATFRKKYTNTKLYTTVIMLTMNLNIICAIVASWFLLDFWLNIFKAKLDIKKIITPAFISIIGLTVFILSLFPTTASIESFDINQLLDFFIKPHSVLLVEIISVCFTSLYLTKNNYIKTFMVYNFVLLLYLFSYIYHGFPHLYLIFFIIIILYLWINTDYKFWISKKSIILCIMLIALLIYPLGTKLKYMHNIQKDINTKNLVWNINNNSIFRNSRIYIPTKIQFIIPYLKDDIEIYNICNLKHYLDDFWESTHCIKNPEYKIQDNNKNVFLISPFLYHSIDYYPTGKWFLYFYNKN